MNLVSLERHTTQTLLGICFWDRITNRVIVDGLRVTAQRLSDDRTQRLGRLVVGRGTSSGAIAFFGLSSAEIPADPDQLLWDTVPPEQLVVIDMVDSLNRFLPLSFVARLPFRGVFRGQGDWLVNSLLRPEVDPDQAMGVQLWSSPTRPVPPGAAVIRSQLVVGDGINAPPAAYALVHVQDSESPEDFNYYGLTDAQGSLLLPMPYPDIPDPVPPVTDYPPLDQQTYGLTITVRHSTQTTLPGSDVPDLGALLNQPVADVATERAADDTLQFESNLSVSLQFGRSLILGTAADPVFRIQSV
ncbi:MAG: hypothetical protein AAF821_13485 [Cyanobacteria bacterium P01_D01_bin.156]